MKKNNLKSIINRCWPVVRISDLFNVRTSKRIFESDWVESGVPFYRTRDIARLSDSKKINTDVFISVQKYNELKSITGVPKIGDLLITATGTLGRAIVIENNDFFYFQDCNILWIKGNKKYNSYYLKYLYKSDFLLNQILGEYPVTTVERYMISIAKKNIIPYPKIDIQNKIVSFLDKNCSKIDTEISLLEKKSELLEEYKQSLIFETVTKGLDKNAEMKDSGIDWIGDINSKLSLVKLKKIYKYKNGYAFSDDDFIDENNNTHLVKITNVNEINIIKSYIHVKERNQFKKFEISDDSILFALSGSIGKCCYFNKEKNTKFYLNQRVAEIKLKSGNSKYLYYIISNYYFKEQILSSTQGNVIKNLNKYDIDNLIIPYNKNKEEQLEIVNYLDFETNKINNNINLINKKIELLKEYKQSLIYEAVTGQLDIE